jgi:hypothetical protein
LFDYTEGLGFSDGVAPLPADNLINNPWFHSSNSTSIASLQGWTNVLQNGIGWGMSDKSQNPTPSGEIGTAARWAEMNGTFYPNLDVYLYQVVTAYSANRKLKFSTWWVSHKVDILEVTVYGGTSQNGPWVKVWTPFSERFLFLPTLRRMARRTIYGSTPILWRQQLPRDIRTTKWKSILAIRNRLQKRAAVMWG